MAINHSKQRRSRFSDTGAKSKSRTVFPNVAHSHIYYRFIKAKNIKFTYCLPASRRLHSLLQSLGNLY